MLGRGTRGLERPGLSDGIAHRVWPGPRGAPSPKLLLLPRGQSAHMGRRAMLPPADLDGLRLFTFSPPPAPHEGGSRSRGNHAGCYGYCGLGCRSLGGCRVSVLHIKACMRASRPAWAATLPAYLPTALLMQLTRNTPAGARRENASPVLLMQILFTAHGLRWHKPAYAASDASQQDWQDGRICATGPARATCPPPPQAHQ